MFVNSESELKKLNRKQKILDKKTVVLIFSNMCGPCHMFLPIWRDFVTTQKQNKNINVIAIEVSFVDGVTNPALKEMIRKMTLKNPYVPNVARYNPESKRLGIFRLQRTVADLKRFAK